MLPAATPSGPTPASSAAYIIRPFVRKKATSPAISSILIQNGRDTTHFPAIFILTDVAECLTMQKRPRYRSFPIRECDRVSASLFLLKAS